MAGSFLPVTLEQLARERGVLWSDKTMSCMAKAAANGTETASRLLTRVAENDNNQCLIRVFGTEITTSSFAMYTFSIAVFVQARALISFSSVADHGKFRQILETNNSQTKKSQETTGRSSSSDSGSPAQYPQCSFWSSFPAYSFLDRC